jgi:polysaccharide export outer membrane protein
VLTKHIAKALLTPLIIASIGACASTQPPPERSAVYTLDVLPGDAVKVSVWREPDLSGTFTVDDRGIVTLPLLGRREVEGLDPAALRELLLADYDDYLQTPSIEVTVLRRINLLGEIRNPGLYPVDATISMADALALAGGITTLGDPNKIMLVRDGVVIAEGVDQTAVIGASDIRSGDQIVVGQKSWFSRNIAVVLGSTIAAAAIIAAAVINNN